MTSKQAELADEVEKCSKNVEIVEEFWTKFFSRVDEMKNETLTDEIIDEF